MAPGCTKFYYKDSTVHYHRLPLNNKPVLKQWIQKMKLKDPPVNKYSRVCGAHFLDEDYITKGSFHDGIFTQEKTSRLKDTAVPTVFDFSKYQTGNTDAPCHTHVAKTPRTKRYRERSVSSAKKQARKVQ